MALSSIILRLARNPGADHPDPDPHDGYALTAPLTEDGHLDAAAFAQCAAQCSVWRFQPDAEDRIGRLVRRGGGWAIHYGPGEEAEPDEIVYRLRDHRFTLGAYISITDGEGALLTYRVTEVAPAHTAAA